MPCARRCARPRTSPPSVRLIAGSGVVRAALERPWAPASHLPAPRKPLMLHDPRQLPRSMFDSAVAAALPGQGCRSAPTPGPAGPHRRRWCRQDLAGHGESGRGRLARSARRVGRDSLRPRLAFDLFDERDFLSLNCFLFSSQRLFPSMIRRPKSLTRLTQRISGIPRSRHSARWIFSSLVAASIPMPPLPLLILTPLSFTLSLRYQRNPRPA
jgi:hypothetical protein